jgi:hypothetical protein
VSSEVIDRIEALRCELIERIGHIEKQFAVGRESLVFFDTALGAYSDRILSLQNIKRQPVVEWTARIQADPELRFSHRKILECLLRHYDPSTGAFLEVHATKLCRESKVGKGRLKGYVRLLAAKGYVRERSDGYRTYVRLNSADLDKNQGQPVAAL